MMTPLLPSKSVAAAVSSDSDPVIPFASWGEEAVVAVVDTLSFRSPYLPGLSPRSPGVVYLLLHIVLVLVLVLVLVIVHRFRYQQRC